MAARKLRYDYFHELHHHYRYRAIAVAHHADDVAETMLLNMVRGAGIAGVHGMAPVQGVVVRPLLTLTGDEIRAYAQSMSWFGARIHPMLKYSTPATASVTG